MKNNRRKMTRRQKKLLVKKIKAAALMVAMVAVMVVIIAATAFVVKSRRADALEKASRPENIVYISYEVQKGDTLWTIAEEKKWDGVSTRSYISEIKQVNGLYSDKITAGYYIILPVEKQ